MRAAGGEWRLAEQVQLEPGWLAALGGEFSKPYMQQLRGFLRAEKDARKVIYPPGAQMFNAFNRCPLQRVKVVILGQDPYHGPGQAHGLCFSVPDSVPPPPSLLNIYQEIGADLGLSMPARGNLESWAEQGVLLLNSVLSVERNRAGSHRGRGWEEFTDRAIAVVSEQCQGVAFMLWGAYAQRKGAVIDSRRHLVLEAPHPSPLSASRGFFGCRHFSRANDYLREQGKRPIDWLPAPAA